MCGIAGSVGVDDSAFVRNAVDKMIHRGPDGTGAHVDEHAGMRFGHCRLAIMDPVGGVQPIYSEDKSHVLVANSEIYNFPRLREQLTDRHSFSTGSDSEAILHLYEERNEEMVAELDGMFAVAISDGDSLFLARDPIGIKPLYYSLETNRSGDEVLRFASELKAMPGSMENVQEFPPGTYYSSDKGFVSYYEVPDLEPVTMPLEEQLRQVRQTLENAVGKRLMSDVPLGAFLSGGLDSSIIAAIARQYVDELHTFSVGVEGSNDILAARRMAEHIGSVHHEFLYTQDDVAECLPDVIYHLESFDQDLVRSAIPTYMCARLAADHVKVILTGEGADELFAGYTYYKDIEGEDTLHAELRRSVQTLHNMNLQRVDRLTMCHGIEGRVPFLDTSLIELAQTIAPSLKLRASHAGPIEKWILRKACEDLLPSDIVWRNKEQFDEGSGTVDLLDEALHSMAAETDVVAYRAVHADANLRSREECYYHQIFMDVFDNAPVMVDKVARWQDNRIQGAAK